jgi:chromate transporter
MSPQPVGLGEIARVFLRIGAMSYGGPAIMGIMQTEIQESRQWLSKKEFAEALIITAMTRFIPNLRSAPFASSAHLG